MRIVAERLQLDIIFVQEPFNLLDTRSNVTHIPGLGGTIRQGKSRSHQRFLSAITFLNPLMDVMVLDNFCTENIAVAEVTLNDIAIILIFTYFPPAVDIAPYIAELQSLIQSVVGKPIIICGDFNSKSETWLSTITDDRGLLVEDFIISNNFFLINEPGNPTTFCSPNGSSNIDLTIASQQCLKVHLDEFHSDHRLITFNLYWKYEKVFDV